MLLIPLLTPLTNSEIDFDVVQSNVASLDREHALLTATLDMVQVEKKNVRLRHEIVG